MFQRVAAAGFLAALSTAFGQSVAGTVAYPDGSAVPSAPVQAKNTATSAAVRTATRADGRFTFSNLAAGAYEIRVSMPCCADSQAVESVTVETPGLIVMLFEDVPGFRQIFLDGRKHPVNPALSWMGHSTASGKEAHWWWTRWDSTSRSGLAHRRAFIPTRSSSA